MPIAIEPEHAELAKSVQSLLDRMAPPEVLHAALEAPVVNPPVYWQAAAEQGLQGLHLAESVDGQGAGMLELAVVIAQFGYAAAPGPFVPSSIASATSSCTSASSSPLASCLASTCSRLAVSGPCHRLVPGGSLSSGPPPSTRFGTSVITRVRSVMYQRRCGLH
ncbi:MAG: acyl-CoA dehydrogenase family protein, partial [Betaproteobacteria bacterium]